MQITRRDQFTLLLPALAAIAAGGAAGSAQAAEHPPLKSMASRFEDLPAHPGGSNISHPIFDGITHAGIRIESHETELGPGQQPHPPHRHTDEEMFLVWDGALDFTVNGKTTRLERGGIGLAGSNDEHGVKNPSTDAKARYFVIAFAPET